jgi:transposase
MIRFRTDMLQMDTMEATEVADNGDHYVIKASGQGEPQVCPACGCKKLYSHGVNIQRFADVPMHGKRVLIEIDRRRFRCSDCGKTLFSSLPEVDSKRLATARFIEYVEVACLRKTFAEMAREVGVDEKTVKNIFDDYVERLRTEVVYETPRVLGIDELKIVGQYRAMITNVEKLSLFDMLPTRNKADLLIYFDRLPDKERVEIITMDMWNVYRQVMEKKLPGRLIVADRFHVTRMASWAMEKVRLAIRRTLDTRTRLKLKDDRFVLLAREASLSTKQRDLLAYWSAEFPLIGAAYRLKEAFHALYEHDSRAKAEKAAKAWKDSIPPELSDTFREVVGALDSWCGEIFNWYEHPISNAYTESINRIAKDMNRMGRGYSFEVIRARLVYDQTARSKTTQSIRARKAASSGGSLSMGRMTWGSVGDDTTVVKTIEYGPHIPTLCDLLEQGHFKT